MELIILGVLFYYSFGSTYWFTLDLVNNRKIEPNTLIKFGLGFIFLGLGYYLLFATKFFATLQGITSLNVFTIALLVITFGELCLSPIGLSIMTKLSTEKLQGMMMGMWFLAAYGQYVAGIIGAHLATAKLVLLITTL
jgi:POT family proton-dependent oligopeptide transporter